MPRRHRVVVAAVAAGVLATGLAVTAAVTARTGDGPGPPDLLTDPYLQLPERDSVRVAWVTEFPGHRHVVLHGEGVAHLDEAGAARLATARTPWPARQRGIGVTEAVTGELSRTREDADSHVDDRPDEVVGRQLWRHSAEVRGLVAGRRTPYRVVSIDAGGRSAVSGTFGLAPLPPPDRPSRLLLTSDHQSMPMTAANIQKVAETVGTVDAVLMAGDLVDVPDRASEWFDDTRGGAFFPVMQGRASRAPQADGTRYRGAEILQNAPLFPVIGNHEVMGRVDDGDDPGGLDAQFDSPVPRDVAEAVYDGVADRVNPAADPGVRRRWIEDNSFSTTTYEELFDLPAGSPGGETYWAYTIGDVRVIGLFATRVWRPPGTAAAVGRFTDPAGEADPLRLGHGSHIFESLDEGSEQLRWLAEELRSPEFRQARHTVVVTHHAFHGVGDNVMTPFTDPVRRDAADTSGDGDGGAEGDPIRYEYPRGDDQLLRHVRPLLEAAGVDVVLSGHSHVWNRFTDAGVHYLETSNVGNTYGAFDDVSGRSRAVPPAPWDRSHYSAQGDPAGLDPVAPNVHPLPGPDGAPAPWVASDRWTVFSILDTGEGIVTSYGFDTADPGSDVLVIDRFAIG